MSGRPKITHCIFFCQSYSTCHYSYSYPNTLKLYRRHCPNNCPYIIYIILSGKFNYMWIHSWTIILAWGLPTFLPLIATWWLCLLFTQLCVNLCDPMDYRMPSLSFTISQSLLRFMSIESVIQPNNLILCCPLLLLPSIILSIRVFSNVSALHIRWPKYWSFNFNISPSNVYSGLISFRTDWFDLLTSKGLSRVFSNTTVQKHQFFGAQLSLWSNSHIHTGLLEKP